MSPPALREWKPRKTVIDLYNEKNATPWYFGLGATVSAMMLAVGFLVSSVELVQDSHPTTTSLVGALVLLILAYLIFAIIFVYSKSWIFQFDVLCIPHLSSSIIGLISFLYVLSINNGALNAVSLLARFGIAALALSVFSIILYSILAVLVYRKIYIVRARDALFHLAPQPKDTGPLRENEEQRRQLSLLLSRQDEKMQSSPTSETQTTFKIEWPGHDQSQRSSFISPDPQRSVPGMSEHVAQTSQTDYTIENPAAGIDRLPSIRVEAPSRFSAWFNTNQSASIVGPPTSHPTSFTNNGAPPIRQDPSTTSPPTNPTLQTILPTTSEPSPLQPVAYIPQSQSARYFGLASISQPGTPQSALPSYTPNAHPSLEISTRPVSRLPQGNGFLVEKKKEEEELDVHAMPDRVQQRLRGEGLYRMVGGD